MTEIFTQEQFKEAWEHRLDVSGHEYPEDLSFITDCIYEKFDIYLSGIQANEIWKEYSQKCYCASWLKPTDWHVAEAFQWWMRRYMR